jgi:hypothetical protein
LAASNVTGYTIAPSRPFTFTQHSTNRQASDASEKRSKNKPDHWYVNKNYDPKPKSAGPALIGLPLDSQVNGRWPAAVLSEALTAHRAKMDDHDFEIVDADDDFVNVTVGKGIAIS